MGKYKYILFDADNTLFDFDKCERAAFIMALDGSPLVYSDAVYADYHVINDRMWKMLERGEIERSKLKTERFRLLFEKYGYTHGEDEGIAAKYERCLGMQCFEIDGAYELLVGLSKRYDVYVITNGLTNVQKSRFSRSRLTAFVKGVFISEEVGHAKPDVRYFDEVISRIGDPDRKKYIVVGDSLTSDIDGAIASGIDCCWYNRKGASPDGRRPEYEISVLSELDSVL